MEVGTGTAGTRFLKTDWPVEDGLEAGTTKQIGRKTQLEAEKSLLSENSRIGL